LAPTKQLVLEAIKTVDSGRIASKFHAISKIGSTESGLNRLAYSESNKEALDLVTSWMREADLEVGIDPICNVFGTTRGAGKGKSVLTGSHIDSVIDGGRFDGTIGVVAGLECMRVISELGLRTKSQIELVVFAGEESSRFAFGTIGSKAIVGDLRREQLYRLKDHDGLVLADAVRRFGGDPDRIADCRRKASEIGSMIELHIEQGPVLERIGKSIGVVNDIVSIDRLVLKIQGETIHSGGGLASMRRDALAGAAEVVLFVERMNKRYPNIRATAGNIQASPGTLNAVPGSATVGLDLRVLGDRRKYLAFLRLGVRRICQKRKLTFEFANVFHQDAQRMSRRIIGVISKIAREMKLDPYRISSFGGHDSLVIAKVAPVGMIFVPSIRGISHNWNESTDMKHVRLGTQLLLASLLDLAGLS